MYEKVTSEITDFAILLWLSVGRIYFFLSFVAINWTSEILYNVTLFSRREYSGMKIVLLLGVDHLSQISRSIPCDQAFLLS